MTDFIDRLELSTRALNRLRDAGVTTREQFLALTKEEIMGWSHAGVGTAREIEQMQDYLAPSPEKQKADRENHFTCLVREINAILDSDPSLGIHLRYGRPHAFKVLT